jgi:hypothetical protein
MVKMEWEGMPVFFGVEEPSAWPFDPFALAFYLVTRYEEYLPFEADGHGRFPAGQSLAYREDFLHLPLVDKMTHHLKEMLLARFPAISSIAKPLHFIPSFDIDIAFAHLGKGWARAGAAWMKLMLKADLKQISGRLAVLRGVEPDPYDNFDLHHTLAARYGHHPLYFSLMGDFGKYDRNISHKNKGFRDLLQKLNNQAEIGLHPSYRAALDPEMIAEEKRRLEEIIGKPVTKNRFHFLRLRFPDSYRLLPELGFTDDYSLGYSTTNGFRASTCTPFCFYDLLKEEKTGLRLHPFIFMDSAMIDHMKLPPGDSILEVKRLVSNVEKFGGEAIGIWHNYSLSEQDQYKGRQEVLATVFEMYKPDSL